MTMEDDGVELPEVVEETQEIEFEFDDFSVIYCEGVWTLEMSGLEEEDDALVLQSPGSKFEEADELFLSSLGVTLSVEKFRSLEKIAYAEGERDPVASPS